MKVLIIDNTFDKNSWGSSELRSFVQKSSDRTAFVRRAPQSDLPESPSRFDRIILSGSRASCFESSPWVIRLDEFLKRSLNEGKPILGICYGHQALTRVLGGTSLLKKGEKGEFGWTEIELIERAPLFNGLPDKFWSFSSHFEEVAELPKGMRNLARSTDCPVQACRLGELPVYGIQFHPEKDLKSANESITEWKKDERKDRVLHENLGPKLYSSNVGERIFNNFLSEI